MKGLLNNGNTCYLNAALQCLLYSPPLVNYVLAGLAEADLHKKRINACAVASEFVSLAKSYWTRPDPPALDPRPLWAAMCKLHKPFANNHPHDAHEALALALKYLHDALARTPRVAGSIAAQHVVSEPWEASLAKDGYSMIAEMFQGQLECAVSDGAGYHSLSYEHFNGLSLDLDGCATVPQAIAKFLAPTDIDDFKLPSGAGARVTQTKRLVYAPLILVVHLKRFDARGHKVDRFVDYSTTLDLQQHGPGAGQYALFAACMHRDGHYVAVCEANGRWFLLDDAAVSELPVNSVVQKDAYVLLYKKKLEQ